MKKIIILTAALLLGVGSVFAVGPWQVQANWSFLSPYYCQSQLTNEYEYKVNLRVYDDANGKLVTNDPEFNIEVWTATSSLFTGAQTKVEAYCDEDHDYTPSFSITVVVTMRHKTTLATYCQENETTSDKSCSDFSNGILAGL